MAQNGRGGIFGDRNQIDMGNLRDFTEDHIEAMSIHLSAPPVFTVFEFVLTLVTIGLYIIDTGSDIYLAWEYYEGGFFTYSWITLGIAVVPAVLITFISVLFYIGDRKNPRIPKSSIGQKFFRIIFSLLQLGTLLRDLNILNYGLRSVLALRKFDSTAQEKYYDYMLVQQADSAFLRLFERFLEAAPQVIFQTFLVYSHWDDVLEGKFGGIFLLISVATSLTSLAWALVVFNGTRRSTTPGKKRLTFWGRVFQFLWHFPIICSRVVTLALFAHLHPTLIAPICAFKWFSLLTVLSCCPGSQSEKKDSGRACLSQFTRKLAFAFVYIFALFNVEDKPKKLKYDLFYLMYFIENSLLLIFCIYSSMNLEVLVSGAGAHILLGGGCLFMCVYFKWFHPSMQFPSLHKALGHWVGAKEVEYHK